MTVRPSTRSALLPAALAFALAVPACLLDVAPARAATEQCWATHYGPQPPGALTASGEVFDNNADTAATSLSRQPQLPFGTRVQVTNVANGRSLVVRINDRGTFAQTPQVPKCLDLTDGAFGRLGGSLNPDAGHIVVTQKVL
ncbi:septal ring lytic transglycosylase RlpA family protein [Streptomyces sp. NPDC100445]|uniref:septal ring lytic transglycosylase RlpA family protein n=1 Tax=Streptomyces sp. NPDC100445 TaxID=3366102 RepID=UPI0037FD113E